MTRQLIPRIAFGSVALAALFCAAGCGGGPRPASVSGHVTYNGKSVTSGTVTFISADGHSSDPGAVQPDGSYSIAHAPTGAMKVIFDNPAPPRKVAARGQGPNNPEADEEAKTAALYVATPPKYKDPAQSGLTCDLKSGKNTYDLDLK